MSVYGSQPQGTRVMLWVPPQTSLPAFSHRLSRDFDPYVPFLLERDLLELRRLDWDVMPKGTRFQTGIDYGEGSPVAASDRARMFILDLFGGFYIDADVFLLRSFIPLLRFQEVEDIDFGYRFVSHIQKFHCYSAFF
ncbi:MAG: glycosyltransferase [archaeon]|nr:glycosyltransferase [archaeon]